MVVIIGRAFLKGQRFIHTGAVRVPGLERAVGGAFDHNIFIVVNILCDGPVDILLDSSAEGIVGVGDGRGALGDLLQTEILKGVLPCSLSIDIFKYESTLTPYYLKK